MGQNLVSRGREMAPRHHRSTDEWTRSDWMTIVTEPLQNLGMSRLITLLIDFLYHPEVKVNCFVFREGHLLLSKETEFLWSYHTLSNAVKSIPRWEHHTRGHGKEIKVLLQFLWVI